MRAAGRRIGPFSQVSPHKVAPGPSSLGRPCGRLGPTCPERAAEAPGARREGGPGKDPWSQEVEGAAGGRGLCKAAPGGRRGEERSGLARGAGVGAGGSVG